MAIVYASQNARLMSAEGLSYNVVQDQVWDSEDPLVKQYPLNFQATPTRINRTVPALERATAAPGEKRGYVRRTPPVEQEPVEEPASAW